MRGLIRAAFAAFTHLLVDSHAAAAENAKLAENSKNLFSSEVLSDANTQSGSFHVETWGFPHPRTHYFILNVVFFLLSNPTEELCKLLDYCL